MRRQTLLTLLTAAMLVFAGCAGSTGGGSPTAEGTATPTDDATTDDGSGGTATGTVKFYVSDQPGQIEDFRHLNVTIDRIEFKRAGSDGESDGTEADDENETETPEDETETPENETESIDDETANETTTNSSGAVASDPAATNSTATPDGDTETETEEDEETADDETEANESDDESEEDGTESRPGWVTYDVDNRTVDLTQLKGDNATLVGTPQLPAGNYTKVFVYVSDVDATLTDGSSQRVKLPSGKLQLNKGFTLEPNGTVSFVYDISVFKAGKSGKYILKPVISQSGTDVDVEDVDDERERDEETDSEPPEDDTTESETAESETTEAGGPPEKPGKN